MRDDRLSNTIIAIAVAAVALIVCIAWFISPSSDKRPPYGLRSGQEEAFQMLVGWHRGGTSRNGNELLRISAFNSPGVARQYSVLESGEERDARECWNWATQDTVIRQLTPEDIQGIRTAASRLPESSEDPSVEHLVVVSFWQGAKWITRSYDSELLPPEMQRILEIIHSREDRLIDLLGKNLKVNPRPVAVEIRQ